MKKCKQAIQWFYYSARELMLRRVVLMLAGLLLICAGHANSAEENPSTDKTKNDWQFSIILYGWAPSIQGETRAGPDFDMDFEEIIENLDGVVMIAGGVRKGKWTVFGDLIYMDLEDGTSARLPGPLGTKVDIDVELISWISTMGAGYTVYDNDKFTVDLFGGARYLYIDADVDADAALNSGNASLLSLSKSENAWNGIVGARGEIALLKQWFATYYVDVGTGDSELTYNLLGLLGYKFEKVSVGVGYRYLRWNFDKGDDFGGALKSMEVGGPFAAVGFEF